MTADDFVKLCYEEKEAILKSYFEEDTNLSVGIMIKKLIQSGTDKEELYRLIDAILAESY